MHFLFSPGSEGRSLPNGMPAPEKIPIPDLSPALHLALQSGEKNSTVFNQLLKECEIFYMAKFPDLSDSSYYQSIGKKLVTKYKCLAFAEGKNPWVCILIVFPKSLSMMLKRNLLVSSCLSVCGQIS